MLTAIPLPESLESEEVFVVTHEHATKEFSLALRSGSTFELGEYAMAARHLCRMLPKKSEFWIMDILDRAYSFIAVQVSASLDAIIQAPLGDEQIDESNPIFNQPEKKIDGYAIK